MPSNPKDCIDVNNTDEWGLPDEEPIVCYQETGQWEVIELED